MERHRSDSPERKKTHQQQPFNEDRISALPEVIIVKILSLLNMKEAVRSGILSKVFTNLWKQVDSLVFEYPDARNIKTMLSFIDSCLTASTSPIIKKFILTIPRGFYYASDLLDKWLAYVLNKNVAVMKLRCMSSAAYFASDSLFRCSPSLVELSLDALNLNKLSLVSLTSLKYLCLKAVDVNSDCLGNMILGCPVLETLVLDYVESVKCVSIRSPSVKKLIVRNFGCQGSQIVNILTIIAPWIEELEITECLYISIFELANISSLKSATLTFKTYPFFADGRWRKRLRKAEFDETSINKMTGLINSLQNVPQLVINSNLIQGLAVAHRFDTRCESFNFKDIRVISSSWKDDLNGIACLLEHSSNLETLVIEVTKWGGRFFPVRKVENLFSNKNTPLKLPNGKFMSLKNLKSFKIDCVKSLCGERERYILTLHL